MIRVSAPYWMRLNNKECELTIEGYCVRDLNGKITCEVQKALTPEGLNVFGVIAQDELEPMRVRLWCAHLGNVHPYGEGVDSAV